MKKLTFKVSSKKDGSFIALIKEVDKKNLPKNIKEQDILSYKDGIYIIDKKETKKVKKNIEAKFKKLLK